MRDIFGIFRSKKKGFEEKLNEMYQEIASKINEMIPTEWEKVYTIAYIGEEGGQVVFFYTKHESNELNYYTNIPKDYNVSREIFRDLWSNLYDEFKKLKELFRESNQEPWTSCEFDFNNEGKLNVAFDYIDWKNSDFGQISREYYYEYKKFGIIPELDYAKKEIKDIEQFIKEQEEK
ncbi:TIGR01741 family protein [Staphylococcus epidermidis]|uniref:TIGR01741 family protein n=1 Tax=Staphylococcus epidermidis TaxID=1282 RepID=UPI0039DF3D8C|nr:TIGR01741 family protein [Staphylococcus epidermidis]